MSLRLFFILGVIVSGLFAAPAFALEIPALTSAVVDEVGLLNSGTRQRLSDNLYQFRSAQQVQLQVYIIKSLEGDSIESVAIQVFDKWKLGDEKTDKGLLLLIAPNEKRMRIEVGQGLEGDIPDVIAKRIITDVVRPYFSRGEFDMGVAQGVLTLQNYITHSDPNQTAIVQKDANPKSEKKSSALIFFILAGLWLILFMFNPSLALYILFAAMRGGGGGGGRGGGWSGGGGRSSGGGASGGW